VCAGLLLLGLLLAGAVFTCNMLLAVFFVALAFNLVRGLDIDCGCFVTSIDASARSPMLWHLLSDALFLAIGFYLFFRLCLEKDKRVDPSFDTGISM